MVDATYMPGRLWALVLQKPDQFLDYFKDIASQGAQGEKTKEGKFLRELGAILHNGTIARGLSDAAALLCNDYVAVHVMEETSFSRLVPLIDEMAGYCIEKHLGDTSHAALQQLNYATRFHYTKTDADFYIRQYDREIAGTALTNGLV